LDNPTHLVTGYFLSRAGLDRFTPYATPILLLSANIPDIDAVSLARGWLNYLHWHRSLTHAFFLSPLLALASVTIVRLFGRKPVPWIPATLVALAGVISHILLDWTNQYGVRFLLPFNARWFQLDNATLFDLWIYAGFAVCLFAPFLARLVGGEIGARPVRSAGRGWAITALVSLCLYFTGRGVIHARLIDQLSARIYDGADPIRVAAFPEASSPFLWRGLVETSAAYYIYSLNAFDSNFDPTSGRTLYKPEKTAAILAAETTPEFREFERFAQYPLWQAIPSSQVERGTQVDLIDLRFPFHCRALVDSSNRIVKTEKIASRALPKSLPPQLQGTPARLVRIPLKAIGDSGGKAITIPDGN
jgi:inner membrane protein